MKHIRKQHVPYLSCHPNGGGRGCTGILLLETEKFVVDELFDELDKPEFLDAIAADEHGARRDEITNALDGLDRQRGELAAMWATPGELSDTEWKVARCALVMNEQRLRQELAELPPPMIGMDIGPNGAWHGHQAHCDPGIGCTGARSSGACLAGVLALTAGLSRPRFG